MFSSVLCFFEFGAGEIMFIMLVALLLFGGDKLPELARGLGKGIRDFKDASEGVKREINNQIDNFESKKTTTPPVAITDEKPVAENESLVVIDNKEELRAPSHSVPILEISAVAAVEPIKEETQTPSEPVHLKETPIEPLTEAHKAENKEA